MENSIAILLNCLNISPCKSFYCYLKYYQYTINICAFCTLSCTLRCFDPEASHPSCLTSYSIAAMRSTSGAQKPGKASSPSERLILTPLNVQWKIKWLYRPLIITQAEPESQISYEKRQKVTLKRSLISHKIHFELTFTYRFGTLPHCFMVYHVVTC